ncbi:hypothetical protein N9X39_04450 [Alphaproteobacteria bacterium]|nr:hypothetical protein [Alphaproteobacteria bacterium]
MNFHLFLWLLAASGRNARILLPLGVVLALLLPSSGAFFKPAAPYILAVLIGAALVRLDIGAVLKAALQPQRLIRNFAISLGLLIIVPVVFFYRGKIVWLSRSFLAIDYMVCGGAANWYNDLDVHLFGIYRADCDGNCCSDKFAGTFYRSLSW